METYSSTDAKREFGEVLTKSQRGPVSVTRNGKPIAVILSNVDYEEMKLRTLRAELIRGQNSPIVKNWNTDEFLARARKRVSGR